MSHIDVWDVFSASLPNSFQDVYVVGSMFQVWAVPGICASPVSGGLGLGALTKSAFVLQNTFPFVFVSSV